MIRASAPLLGLMFGACQSVAAPVPAVLLKDDPAALASLKAALVQAVGRADVQLGAGDPAESPVISVLPPRLAGFDDRSPAMPAMFRLEIEGGACFVVGEDNGSRVKLDGQVCRPAGG